MTKLERTAIPKYLEMLVFLGVVDTFLVKKREYYSLDKYVAKKLADKGQEIIDEALRK